MKTFRFLALLGLFLLPLQNQPLPLQYHCPRVQTPVVIDGTLDDDAWGLAAWSSPFVDIRGTEQANPRYTTRMKMLWDRRFLYIGAELQEPNLWGTIRTRDSVVFRNNDFEVFIDPDGDSRKYVELEINTLGTVWDLLMMRTYKEGGPALTNWNITGLRSAVHLEGTLNNPADRDSGWTIEIAIPWETFDTLGVMSVPPKPGDQWRMNFSRVEWKLEAEGGSYRKASPKEDNWVWSPQGVVNMHLPDRWGTVVFVVDN